jgi:hypothetical protein
MKINSVAYLSLDLPDVVHAQPCASCFTRLNRIPSRLGQVLFHHLQHVRPAMPRHDDALMFHTRLAVPILDDRFQKPFSESIRFCDFVPQL